MLRPDSSTTSPPPGAPETEARLRQAKQDLRWERWNALREAGAARFPGVVGRIPNFRGAEAAAERLTSFRWWRRARVVACNPDLPQRPIRVRALRAGKVVLLPTEKLAAPVPFVRIDPSAIPPSEHWAASSLSWAMQYGQPLPLEELETVELVVLGSVAVAPDGARLGKGGGSSDLEYGLLREAGVLSARAPVVTTVHPSQVVDIGRIPMRPHDLSVDVVVQAEEVLNCPRTYRRPRGLLWDRLDPERLEAIPALGGGGPLASEGLRRRKA